MRRGEKRCVDDLAVLGGPVSFSSPLHVGRPNLGSRRRLLSRVRSVLDRRWLTNDGPLVREFEREVARVAGTAHCIALCNATLGLELAISAAGLSGEVIVPSFTFVATPHVLLWRGITPVFCDVDPRTHNLDPAQVEALVSPKTTGVLAVHLWGRPCDVEALEAITERHKLTLLFDAAHAFGCSYRGRPVGRLGLAEVFSFHATKFVNSAEGGAVVTDDDELADRLRLLRNFGFTGYDTVAQLGINAKMSEFAGAVGLTNLESMDEVIEVNRSNHAAYREELAGIEGLCVLDFDPRERSNYQYVVVEVDVRGDGPTRDALVDVLHAENVLARRYFSPGCHRVEPYRSMFPDVGSRLPVTERLAGSVLTLPTGTAVNRDDIVKVCALIRFVTKRWAEIAPRLAAPSPGEDHRA